ncbi:MAG TPA: oligosaccharide flippase family protein [Nocardioidaceae bacterium]|jgi:O-antigen/teichoic acid export membrane protein|nr:oligosaccharide flippase family protein [Nocardioidaceae bacterium]
MHTARRAPAPARTLTGAASLNALAYGLDYGVRAVVELVVSPLLVSGLGPAVYGAWRVLLQWSSYVWGTSGRSAQALQSALSNRQWTARPDEKRALVGAAVVVWLVFLPLLLVTGGMGVWLGPGILGVPDAQVTAFRVAAGVLVLDAMAVTLVTLPRSALQGENLGYARLGLSTVLVVLGGTLLALAATAGTGLPGMAAATVTTTLLTGWTFWLICRRRLAWFGVARPSRSLVGWFLRLSAWFLGWKFVLELLLASDVLLLAVFTSLSLVAAYALSKWVADALAQVLALLVQATIPGIGGYLGRGATTTAARLRGEVMSLVWLVGTATGATIVVWNGTFVGLWVGPRLYIGVPGTVLVVVLALQVALIRTDTFILDVSLRPRAKVVAGLAAAAVSLVLAAAAVGPLDLGVVGLCGGLVLGRAVLGVVAPVAVGRHLGVPLQGQVRASLRPGLVTAVLLAAAAWAAPSAPTGSWWLLVTGTALTVGAVGVVAWFGGLDRAQRGRLGNRVRALRGRAGTGASR